MGNRIVHLGFTLIELVVIVILGILAVIVAPKFINSSSEAQRTVQASLGVVDSWYRYPETLGEQGVGYGIVELIFLGADGVQVFAIHFFAIANGGLLLRTQLKRLT